MTVTKRIIQYVWWTFCIGLGVVGIVAAMFSTGVYVPLGLLGGAFLLTFTIRDMAAAGTGGYYVDAPMQVFDFSGSERFPQWHHGEVLRDDYGAGEEQSDS